MVAKGLVIPSGGSATSSTGSRTGAKPLQPTERRPCNRRGQPAGQPGPQRQQQEEGDAATVNLASVSWRPVGRGWPCSFHDSNFVLEVRASGWCQWVPLLLTSNFIDAHVLAE
jgi:hypothetical protein